MTSFSISRGYIDVDQRCLDGVCMLDWKKKQKKNT